MKPACQNLHWGCDAKSVAKIEEFRRDQLHHSGRMSFAAIRGERKFPVPLEDAIANLAVNRGEYSKRRKSGKWGEPEKT